MAMKSKAFSKLALLLCAWLLLGTACLGRGPSPGALLRQDFTAMDNAELVRYYQSLNDAIAGQRGGRTGFGLGVGVGVGSGSVAVGASQGIRLDDPTDALRARRNQVRLELDRRGLTPPDAGGAVP
jgi:hypothetical protein